MSRLALHGGEPVLKLPIPSWPIHDEHIREALVQAWEDGSWGRYEGRHSARLVQLLAEMHEMPHVLPCSSGTIAVEISLRGLQVGPGDEVILAGYDFGGNFRAIEAVGARPVLVDINQGTWCLDATLVAAAVTPQVRALVVSHLHGGLADMQSLRQLAAEHSFAIVEDACQAPGAAVQGRIAGSWGDVSVLSFGGSKLLSAGRGGAVMTRREELFQRAKVFCERGNHAFPLSELQAAVLPPQLGKLAERNRIRGANVERLIHQLAGMPALRPVVDNPANSCPSYYKLGFLYDPVGCGNWTREQFLVAIQAEGAPLDAGFRGFTRRGSSRCRQSGSLEHSRQAAERTIVLHHPVLLEPAEIIDLLAGALHKVVNFAQQHAA